MRKWVEALVILVVLCLSWYGAEMLLYNYCQMSVVKAFIAVCISVSIASGMEKQRMLDEKRNEIATKLLDGIKKGMEEAKNGKAQNQQQHTN